MKRALLVASLLLFGAASQAPMTPPATAAPPVPATPAPASYATLTSGMERSSGLFDVLSKNGSVYFDLGADALDRTFVIEPIVASGIGTAFTGYTFDAIPIKFVRDGQRILWVVPNSNFVAPTTAWAKLALEHSTSDSVIGFSPILAENAATKRIVFAPTLLAGDFADVAAVLNPQPAFPIIILGAPKTGYAFQAAESSIASAKAFPQNVEVRSNLTFTAPVNAPPTIADRRGARITMHYSIVALPENNGYAAREADDRVGYFVDTLKRLDDQGDRAPFVRYILRWDMRNKPIVYYLTNEIPPEYRPAVKRALLTWNEAFERIGIHDAIEVRDQPSDPKWDPDDARYSSVRWITSDTPSFGAYTSFFSDPYTGQIFRSEIVIDGAALRAVRYGYAEQVLPALNLSSGTNFEAQSIAEALFAQTAVQTFGLHVDGATFAKQWLQAAVTHEAGHALGLRHNFAGSTLYSLAQIHDPSFTAVHGLSASVMDYLPVNISPPKVRQGAYFQLNLGPYDYWAIKYGYTTTQTPQSVAQQSSRPEYRYGTDDEAAGIASVDPRIAPFDLSSDPLAYDAEQFDLTRAIVKRLDARFPKDDTRYYDERLAFMSVMQNYERASLLAVRYIGGEYTSRTHRGQAGGRPPFTPVSRSTAHQAFQLIASNVFEPRAFAFPSALVRDLGSDYFYGWGDTRSPRPDFPVLSYANTIQGTVLYELFGPIALGRIYDAESTSPGPDTLRLEDIFEWTRQAVFSGLDDANSMSAAHRELQRQFIDLMSLYQAVPGTLVQNALAPREMQALARYELEKAGTIAQNALKSPGLDVTTRAHLEDIVARTHRALSGINILGM